MEIIRFSERLGSNSYLVCEGDTAVLIDCAVEAEKVTKLLKEKGCRLKYILLTHGHFDHICTLDEVREAAGAEVLISTEDGDFLTDAVKNGSKYLTFTSLTASPADGYLPEDGALKAGEIDINIIRTPGHTDGSVCYKIGELLFSGDTLFEGSIGRMDLYSGDESKMKESLKHLMTLPDSTPIYPGHGGSTTVGDERTYNPYIKCYNLPKRD